jgi:hypothetical protein
MNDNDTGSKEACFYALRLVQTNPRNSSRGAYLER